MGEACWYQDLHRQTNGLVDIAWLFEAKMASKGSLESMRVQLYPLSR